MPLASWPPTVVMTLRCWHKSVPHGHYGEDDTKGRRSRNLWTCSMNSVSAELSSIDIKWLTYPDRKKQWAITATQKPSDNTENTFPPDKVLLPWRSPLYGSHFLFLSSTCREKRKVGIHLPLCWFEFGRNWCSQKRRNPFLHRWGLSDFVNLRMTRDC